jgi:hypothetical protein
VIAGDMNIAPADADVYDPAAFVGSTHVTRRSASGWQRILDAMAGLVDAYRELHPDESPVHLVGLPGRQLPQGPRAADRPRAGQRELAGRLWRAGSTATSARAQALRPRAAAVELS